MNPLLNRITRFALAAGVSILCSCASTAPPVFATTPGPETSSVVNGVPATSRWRTTTLGRRAFRSARSATVRGDVACCTKR